MGEAWRNQYRATALDGSLLLRQVYETHGSTTKAHVLVPPNKTPKERRLKITDAIREAYAKRDKSLDNADPENPVLPPEMWENATIGKYYEPPEPHKTQISVTIDNDVFDWLKSKGLTRINEILREQMLRDRRP